jgi:predicted O-linked N-acetylglucosamine transferase (SPINDLY family)
MTLPTCAADLTKEAIALHRRGRLVEAKALYEAALKQDVSSFEARHMLGVVTLQEGHPDRAIELISEALAQRPGAVDAITDLGFAYLSARRFDDAIVQFDRALALRPDDVETLLRRATAALELKRPAYAAASLECAIALAPDAVEMHMLLGKAYEQQGRHEDALARFDHALTLAPSMVEIHAERGHVLFALTRYADALDAYAKAMPADVSDATLLYNRGIAKFALGARDAAIADFDAALRIRPDYADALFGRATALVAKKRDNEAVQDYAAALAINPDIRFGLGYLSHGRALQCDWSDYDSITRRTVDGVRAGKPVTVPLPFLGISDEPEQLLACADTYVRALPVSPTPIFADVRGRRDKLRIAYLSANYNEHAVAYLITELFERHDRSRFEIHGISFGADDGGPMLARIRDCMDSFMDVRNIPDGDVARTLRGMEVDIAVDLMGHTNEARAGILAHRAAPVQVNFLGYPGTMGGRFIDYILADRFIIPYGDERFYSEQVVRLPDCYQPNDTTRRISENVPSRAALGLPDDGFVFCCFNNTFKLNPPIFDVWMRLLREVQGSVLWLLEANEAARRNLALEAEKRGVPRTRLVFARRASLDTHLARHRAADLFLDTLPYNAHTTASDCLWAGLPLLTCAGNSFASRVAGSLLHAAGIPELVTRSVSEYEARARELAKSPHALQGLRDRLLRDGHRSPLFDIERFGRHIERAYETMWEIRQRGDGPTTFDVPAIVS